MLGDSLRFSGDFLEFYKILIERCLRILWNFLGFIEIFWDFLGYFGIFRDSLGFFEILWDAWGYLKMLRDSLTVKRMPEDSQRSNNSPGFFPALSEILFKILGMILCHSITGFFPIRPGIFTPPQHQDSFRFWEILQQILGDSSTDSWGFFNRFLEILQQNLQQILQQILGDSSTDSWRLFNRFFNRFFGDSLEILWRFFEDSLEILPDAIQSGKHHNKKPTKCNNKSAAVPPT